MLILLLCFGIVHGELAPDFTLTDIDGNTFSLGGFRGKAVIIEFFVTWCGYCIKEIPHLKVVHNEFGERQLVIISISRSDTNTQLIDFRNEYQIPWSIAEDTANVFQLYSVPSVPDLYLIDPDGVITYHHKGVVEASVLIEKIYEIVPELLGDLNNDRIVDIYDVVTASIAFGSRQGDDNWNPIADIVEPHGEVDIFDVVTVTKNFGKTA